MASEDAYHGSELRHYTHVYVMKSVTKEKIDNLLEELCKPDAFPEDEPKPVVEMPLSIGASFTTVVKLKRWLSTAKQNLHNGMVVKKEDAAIIKATRRLMSWPREGRGFK